MRERTWLAAGAGADSLALGRALSGRYHEDEAFESRFLIGASVGRDELTTLRKNAARFFFAALLWVHVPIVVVVAATNGMPTSDTLRLAGAMALAAFVGTWAALAWGGDWKARCTLGIALTAAPVLMVAASADGPWQVDYHMYFFVVFGMLVAFVDWASHRGFRRLNGAPPLHSRAPPARFDLTRSGFRARRATRRDRDRRRYRNSFGSYAK